jgi:hypothetical protein
VLNHLVTGASMMLEFKHKDAVRIRNFTRLYVDGNADWIVPSGMRERRWAVFDIGDDHIQDRAYFAAIDEEMDNGGREALLRYLLDFDLKEVDMGVIPRTEALLEQQIEGLPPLESWWLDVLSKGYLPPRPAPAEKRACEKTDLHRAYMAHADHHRLPRRALETQLGMFLHKQLRQDGKDLLVGFRPRLPNTSGKEDLRPQCYRFPPLRKCRELFAEQLGQRFDWGENWEKQDWEHWNDWPHKAGEDEEEQSSCLD